MQRHHAGIMPGNPPVMSGRLLRTIIGNEQDLSISLSRQVAWVMIYPLIAMLPGVLGANVTIEGVKFTRLAGNSYLFEQQPAASPAGNTWDQTSFARGPSMTVTATTRENAVAYPALYYIPEHLATGAATAILHRRAEQQHRRTQPRLRLLPDYPGSRRCYRHASTRDAGKHHFINEHSHEEINHRPTPYRGARHILQKRRAIQG